VAILRPLPAGCRISSGCRRRPRLRATRLCRGAKVRSKPLTRILTTTAGKHCRALLSAHDSSAVLKRDGESEIVALSRDRPACEDCGRRASPVLECRRRLAVPSCARVLQVDEC
jgi:hypothetical protein